MSIGRLVFESSGLKFPLIIFENSFSLSLSWEPSLWLVLLELIRLIPRLILLVVDFGDSTRTSLGFAGLILSEFWTESIEFFKFFGDLPSLETGKICGLGGGAGFRVDLREIRDTND